MIDEFGSENLSRLNVLAIETVSLINYRKPVAAPQVPVEVDFCAEDFRQLNGDRVRQANVVGRGKQ